MKILTVLCDALSSLLGGSLLGLYVTGSYVWGDFDEEISDIDLVAVLDRDVDEALFARLADMHASLDGEYPAWAGRVEVVYIGRETLANALEKDGVLAVISPGDPLHMTAANKDWFINWYFALHYGRTLYGAPPQALMPAITRDRFVEIVRHEALMWRGHVASTKGSLSYQSYACITMCRALYAVTTGEQASKKRAVAWYAQTHPENATLLEFCWQVRSGRHDEVSPDAFYPAAESFVLGVLEEIERT